MKNQMITKLAALALAVTAMVPSLHAQIAIPNADGSDGALIVSNSMTINLANAVTGNWTNNNAANMGKGIYDPTQWAVVFKYSSVVISNGAVLTFANNATHAPVVWLVGSNSIVGNVTINGEVSLDGQAGSGDPVNLSQPGPGGFRGGGGPTYGGGTGFGPGGGNGVGVYSGTYGNPQILPLIGGAGGGGGSGNNGGCGGGAILIAASGTITVNNYIHANGGSTSYASGSGGGIRLVANQILGAGTIQALGGSYYAVGGPGRIRLESAQPASNQLFLNPSLPPVLPDVPPIIFPAANAPTVTIWSVAGLTPPADPQAPMTSSGNEDLTLVTTNNVVIQVRTTNFPTNGSTVNVYIKPRNAGQTVLTATAPTSGDTNSAIWSVTNNFSYQINQGHTVIQARAFH